MPRSGAFLFLGYFATGRKTADNLKFETPWQLWQAHPSVTLLEKAPAPLPQLSVAGTALALLFFDLEVGMLLALCAPQATQQARSLR